jgi:DNA-binding PadR family transcriptional regulator
MARDALLTLTPTAFEILLTLADGERHGYGILVEVEERTGGRVRLRPGSLYRALHRLLEQDLVEEAEAAPGDRREGEGEDERRRYYRITAGGLAAVRNEAERMARSVRAARAKALIPGEEAP